MKIPNLLPTILLAFQTTHVLSAPVSPPAGSDLLKRHESRSSDQTTTTNGATQGAPGKAGTGNVENVYTNGNNARKSSSSNNGGTSTKNGGTSSGANNNGNVPTYSNQGNGFPGTINNGGSSSENNSTTTAGDGDDATTGYTAGGSSLGGSPSGLNLKSAAHPGAGKSPLISFLPDGSPSGTNSGTTTGGNAGTSLDDSSSGTDNSINTAQGTPGKAGLSNTHNAVYADGTNLQTSTSGPGASASAGGGGNEISVSSGDGGEGGEAWAASRA